MSAPTIHVEPGWVVFEHKMTTDAIVVKSSPAAGSKKVWTPLATLTADHLEPGKWTFYPELAATINAPKTRNIKTQVTKAGGTDPSKRTGHEIGGESGWASTEGVCAEDVSAADLPLTLWIWMEATEATVTMKVTKVIWKAHEPLLRLRGKLP